MYQNRVKELELEWTRIIPKAVIAHYIPPASTSVMSSLPYHGIACHVSAHMSYVEIHVRISVFNT